jgi:hypothetical protein
MQPCTTYPKKLPADLCKSFTYFAVRNNHDLTAAYDKTQWNFPQLQEHNNMAA